MWCPAFTGQNVIFESCWQLMPSYFEHVFQQRAGALNDVCRRELFSSLIKNLQSYLRVSHGLDFETRPRKLYSRSKPKVEFRLIRLTQVRSKTGDKCHPKNWSVRRPRIKWWAPSSTRNTSCECFNAADKSRRTRSQPYASYMHEVLRFVMHLPKFFIGNLSTSV